MSSASQVTPRASGLPYGKNGDRHLEFSDRNGWGEHLCFGNKRLFHQMDRIFCVPQPSSNYINIPSFWRSQLSNNDCGRCSGDRNIPLFGAPMVLHTDQGLEFRSDLMREISELLEIPMSRTAPYDPQSNGQVERFNHTLMAMLSKLRGVKGNWDDHLPYVMCAYRSTIRESTRSSPNRMVLGR